MASLSGHFRADTDQIRLEHLLFEFLLNKLDAALGPLAHESGNSTGPADREAILRFARILLEEFPGHCCGEEEALFPTVSGVSTELAEFCEEMKLDHAGLQGLLEGFRLALATFQKNEHRDSARAHLLTSWAEFSTALREHLAREESELSGFL
jgi:hemerythrin-like domain-containing protein